VNLDALIDFLFKKYLNRLRQNFDNPHYQIEYIRGYQDASKDILEFLSDLENNPKNHLL
jgi:hypothetical protein